MRDEDDKWLSGYQKIRMRVIRTAGYQVKEQKEDGWIVNCGSSLVDRDSCFVLRI